MLKTMFHPVTLFIGTVCTLAILVLLTIIKWAIENPLITCVLLFTIVTIVVTGTVIVGYVNDWDWNKANE